MFKYFIYKHVRLDKNEPFYIGIGTKPKKFKTFEEEYTRAFRTSRSQLWQKIATKAGYKVEIIYQSNNYEDIKEMETLFINRYGRINKGTGPLANIISKDDENPYGLKYRKEHLIHTTTGQPLKTTKKIYMYDEFGNYIDYFYCIDEANRVLDIAISCHLLRKNRNWQFGYFWFYEHQGYQLKELPIINKHKPVYLYSLEGNFIKTFKKWKEIREEFPTFSTTKIDKSITRSKNLNPLYGFYWTRKYSGEKINIKN